MPTVSFSSVCVNVFEVRVVLMNSLEHPSILSVEVAGSLSPLALISKDEEPLVVFAPNATRMVAWSETLPGRVNVKRCDFSERKSSPSRSLPSCEGA